MQNAGHLTLHLCFKEFLCASKVFRCVDAYRLYVGNAHTDAVAVLQPTKLFQALRLLQCRLGKLGNFVEHLTPIGIDAQMLQVGEVLQPMSVLFTTNIGYDATTTAQNHDCHTLSLGSWGFARPPCSRKVSLGCLSGFRDSRTTPSRSLFVTSE